MTLIRWLILALFVASLVAVVMAVGIRVVLRLGKPEDDSDMPDYISPEKRQVERLRKSGM